MTIFVNAEKRDVPDGLSVAALVAHLGLHPSRIAVERNLEILPRSRWGDTMIELNDRYEIVQLVGGG